MKKKRPNPAGRVNVNWQQEQAHLLWRIQRTIRFLAWSVFGLAAAYVLNAVAGRVWP